MKRKRNKYTSGSILKSLISLSIPIVGANILQTLYQLTDTFWVGRLGPEAVAAVSLSFPIIFLLISLGGGFAIAGSILVAQYKGKEDTKQINIITGQTLAMVAIVSLITTLVGYIIAPYVIGFMGAEPGVFTPAVEYLRISFLGMFVFFGFFVIQAILRGIGEVKKPFYIVLVTVLLNLILDPLFIFGFGAIPAYGVKGAAIATIITQTVAAIAGFFVLMSGEYNIHPNLKNFIPKRDVIIRMIKLGFPASIEQSFRAVGLVVMTTLAAMFGTSAIAAYGIGSRVFSFVIIPALGLSESTLTLVGQNIGADKKKRAEKTIKYSVIFSFISLSIAGIFAFVFSKEIAGFFLTSGESVIDSSALFIRFLAPAFGLIGVTLVISGALRGAGETLPAMILTLISFWVFQFPLAYFLSQKVFSSELGIWMAFPITNLISAVASVAYLMTGRWKKKQLLPSNKLKNKITDETIIEEGIQ